MTEVPLRLQKDETLAASVLVDATPAQVYDVVSDVTRIPEWSPETIRCAWLDDTHFRAWNQRRIGLWRSDARVAEADPGRTFGFVVRVMGGDWTQWTYRMSPGSSPGTTVLTEEVRMCIDVPVGIFLFDLLFLFVRDRRVDLQRNLELSVERIQTIVERPAPTHAKDG